MTTGVLPFSDLKIKVNLNTGFFETSGITENAQMAVTSGNHDDAGLSIGNLQYNFGPADRAQEWFKYMIDNHVSVVNSAFGANTTELATFKNVINTYTRANRITWGDSISALVNGEKRALIEPYKSAFATMLTSTEGKAKYYSMSDAYYWTPSYELFRHLSCKSRFSIASLFDVYVNKGRYYPVNLLVADFDAIDANGAIDAIEKERQKNYAINYRGNYDNAVKPTENAWGGIDQITFWHGDGVDDGRRGCMANQEGNYYGTIYAPETNFDINQEPATDEKVGSTPINVNLGEIAVDNIFLGTTQVSKLYLGTTLIGGGEVSPVTSSRVPKTQFRTNAGSYAGIPDQTKVTLNSGDPLWIDCQEPFVGCRTYYTKDGSTPTTSSALYSEALTFTGSCTLKTLTVSVFGIAEAVKTLAVTVNPIITSWRYLKIQGYGTSIDTTTRLIEFEAWHGATNRMTLATILSNDAISTGSTDVNTIKDGVKTIGTNTYPIWWSAVPNANVVIDLGDWYALTKLNYYSYSTDVDQRQNRFKVFASTTNNGTDWVLLWDMSANTTPQPVLPNGYEKTL